MDFSEILNILVDKENSRELHFIAKRKDGYYNYSPEVSIELFDSIIEECEEKILNKKDTDFQIYNPCGCKENVIEYSDISYIHDYDKLISSMSNNNIEANKDDFSQYNFYCISISNIHEKIEIYRRIYGMKRLYSKGVKAIFQGGQLTKFDNKMICIDGEIDLIVYNEKVIIFNHTAYERIFNLKPAFETKSKECLALIKNNEKIDNFEQFKEDCMSNENHIKMLTRMLNEEIDLSNSLIDFNKIIHTNEVFGLNLNLDVDNCKIIYDDKSHIRDILNLACDAFYKSIMQEKYGIDNKI